MSLARSLRFRWRWPRLGVRTRTMLTAVLIAACTMGWIVHRARVQREAVAALHRAGGYVKYEWRVVSPDGLIEYEGTPWAPKWLMDRFGVDYFGSVVAAGATTGDRLPAGLMAHIARLDRLEEFGLYTLYLTDDEMAHIGRLTKLTSLFLPARVSGAGLAKLSRLHQLKKLALHGSTVNDSAMAHVIGLAKLEFLDLRGTDVTDQGLAQLRNLPNLKMLFISGPKFTDSAVEELRRALPNLKIAAPDRPDLTINRSALMDVQLPKLVPPARSHASANNGC
jgi:hypothetical protein